MKRWLLILVAGFAAFVYGGDDFADIQQKIVSYKLENGLTIILYPRPSAPVISCITYVNVGSVDEHVGITGIAHQLEHLAFKGTPFIGTKNFGAEQKVFAELDGIYRGIQAFEQKLPVGARDAFLSLLAQYTSTGAPAQELAEKIEKELQTLAEGWKKEGMTVSAEEQKELTQRVLQYAQKVKSAEEYVEQNQYSNAIDRAGGTGLNAFTSSDCTCYLVSLPANRLELWAALESDRFLNTVPRQLEKEKQVVLEERRMRTESNPSGKLYENFIANAFIAHPYGVSVIGHRSDILGYTREKIMRFYNRHYTPRNTTVCIVGDIDVPRAREVLNNYFGKIPRGEESEPLVTVEPKQDGERRFEVEFPAQPLLMMGFHIPEQNHPDTPALMALEKLLSEGRSSRFSMQLIKTGKAQNAGSWLGPGERFPRLLVLSAEPTKDGSMDALEADILAEIERLKVEPPTAEELQRVTTAHRAAVLRQLKQNLNLAITLAQYQATAGDWRTVFREIQELGKVTPEQVTAMAKKYLTKQNRTVGRLVTRDK